MTTRPTQDSRVLSHGRGGAGKPCLHITFLSRCNLAKNDPTLNQSKPEDLVTPTLKSSKYTTGRGGTGNMAQNDPERPELARAAQDVEAPAQVSEPKGPTHYGRGGAANIIDKDGQRNSGDVKRKSAEAKRKSEEGKREEGGILAKGKELLNKLGKK
ncbi:hypothetical protein CC86DRAFT_390251 [Ophiobolus disseminans]|uniref:Uncharacterized protein n=1 Tax=Ophiobolus disseminans TaxID=1469910 RepID=A0A6A7AFQ8_9PLEO|nr:hypothetical protein CC86DRAFT_390251 [Ophiobolus disseminans]